MESLSLTDQRVLIREDNVPIKDGVVANDADCGRQYPRSSTRERCWRYFDVSLGQPRVSTTLLSLAPVADALTDLLGLPVTLMSDWPEHSPVAGDVTALKRSFNEGEDDQALARRYASLCDVFVMDAFGTAHRAQASTPVLSKASVSCEPPASGRRGTGSRTGRTEKATRRHGGWFESIH